MNSPIRTFILTGLVVSMLLVMQLLPQISIEDIELRRVNMLSDILPDPNYERDGINDIPVPVPPKRFAVRKNVPIDTADTMPQAVKKAVADTVGQAYTTFSDGMIVDYSEGNPGGMTHFYHQLALASERPVRIAYYGDSFVEGDVVTGDLREMLQDRFGGSGVGWVDCTDHLGGFRQTVRIGSSGLSEYEVVSRPFNPQLQGISQRYFTAGEDARTWASGSKRRRHLSQWEQSFLYFRSDSSLQVTTYVNGDTIGIERISGSPHVQMVAHRQSATSSVGFQITGLAQPAFLYGMSIESPVGVVLDNFSMRGSSGVKLAKIPLTTLTDFARLRPYDLIVLHFGLNVANEKSHAVVYENYIHRMQQAVEHLQKAHPDASILIISMPDRDQRTDAGIRTMKGVESLVAYQQILAGNCHVAYFNLFAAMGGRESMKALVDEGLANKDYTHLTFSGGRRIGRIIYDALMAGYHDYQ